MHDLRLTPLLSAFKTGLAEIYGKRLRGLYLFGSHARGEAGPESDVDVAIVLDDFESEWEEIQRTSHLVASLSLEHGVSLVPVNVREHDWYEHDFPFYRNLRREGIAV